jgi:hypothetical protein
VCVDRGRWRYRTTAYYGDGTSVRITGSVPRYEDTRDKALEMEAKHIKRVRELLPGQEEPTQHTIANVPAEPAKPLVPTVNEFHVVYLDSERLGAKPSTIKNKVSDFRNHIVPRLVSAPSPSASVLPAHPTVAPRTSSCSAPMRPPTTRPVLPDPRRVALRDRRAASPGGSEN